jgi:hypothetical protein
MPQNPPRFFAPRYFAPGYWGGEQVEGSVSAALMGSSAMTAVLTGVQNGFTGGYLWRRKYHPIQLAQPVPAFMSARLAGGSWVTVKAKATAAIAGKLSGQGQAQAGIFAVAPLSGAMQGAGSMAGTGLAYDAWAQARKEEEFWLIAA